MWSAGTRDLAEADRIVGIEPFRLRERSGKELSRHDREEERLREPPDDRDGLTTLPW
jgi:hypothetical protein